jgi:hypothetical protein
VNNKSLFADDALRLDLVAVAFLALMLVCSFVFVSKYDFFWSLSADYAHHYSLVSRIADFGLASIGNDPSLGEMKYYPNYSHAVSAVLGRISDSPFLGMHVVELVSFFLLWGGFGLLLRSVGVNVPAIVKLIVAILLLRGVKLAGLEVHGYEIIGNYFFAQLVSQALVILFLAIWARLRCHGASSVVEYLFVALACVLTVGFHLLPALILAACLGLVVVIDIRSGAVTARSSVMASLGLLGALALAVFFHPSFQGMRHIAENDGILDFHFISSASGIAAFAFILAIACVCFLRGRRAVASEVEACSYDRMIGIYVLSGALLTLLQFTALIFGFGSAYAVKKYGFCLFSGLFLLAYLYIIRWLEGRKWVEAGSRWTGLNQAAYLLFPAILTYMAACAVFPPSSGLYTTRMIELDRSVRGFLSSEGPAPIGKYDIALGASDMGPVVDYALSVGALRMPKGAESLAIHAGKRPADYNAVRYLVTRADKVPDSGSGCVKRKLAGGLVAADANCVALHETQCAVVNDLSASGKIPAISLFGFSQGEPAGRWSLGAEASFKCTLPDEFKGKVKDVRVSIVAGFSGNGKGQLGYLSVNGMPEREVDASSEGTVVSLGSLGGGDAVTVHFRLPNAISPKAAGVSTDDRILGFMVKNIELVLN